MADKDTKTKTTKPTKVTTPEPDDEAEPATEELRLLDTGEIRATWTGSSDRAYNLTLARPKMRDLRALRELLDDLSRESQSITRAQLSGDDEAVGEAEAKTVRTIVDWQRKAFELLGDKPLPEDEDELPVWIENPGLPAQMIQHWRQVPLARGGR